MAAQLTTERLVIVSAQGMTVLVCSAMDGVVLFVSGARAAICFRLKTAAAVRALTTYTSF